MKIKDLLFHLKVYFTTPKSKVKKTKDDPRDLDTGIFGWFGYVPKRNYYLIPPLSIKNQGRRNTCVFEATTGQKERDEEKILSVRSMVGYAKRHKLLRGNGYSNLRWGQKVLKKWGILEYGYLNEKYTTWQDWSTFNLSRYRSAAAKYKILSYWRITSMDDVYKLLDNNRVLVTAIKWHTGYNMSGGFKKPWIIDKKMGISHGAHAFQIIGYNQNYHGQRVLICQQTWGGDWGDSGKFYITEDFLEKATKNYGFFTNLDIPKDIGYFVKKYNIRNVKAPNNPSVYFIQRGKKHPYPNWLTYLAFNGKDKKINIVKQQEINEVPTGEPMDITKSPHWDFLQRIKQDKQLEELLIKLYS